MNYDDDDDDVDRPGKGRLVPSVTETSNVLYGASKSIIMSADELLAIAEELASESASKPIISAAERLLSLAIELLSTTQEQSKPDSSVTLH